jgi:amino-acid N-acetyltransferase
VIHPINVLLQGHVPSSAKECEEKIVLRKAKIEDVRSIHRLLAYFSERGELLSRSLSDLYDHLRDYFVATGEDGKIDGVCALHICWEGLAEIRSLAVDATSQRKGVGSRLVEACLSDAIALGIYNIFVLTYRPTYFARFGFEETDKSALPHKIWADCVKCVKFPECDEVAMVLKL